MGRGRTVATVLLALVAAAPPAAAGPVSVRDPRGDAVGGEPRHDLVQLHVTTVRAPGKQLVVTLRVAGRFRPDPWESTGPVLPTGTSYTVRAATSAGTLHLSAYRRVEAESKDEVSEDVARIEFSRGGDTGGSWGRELGRGPLFRVRGTTITWTLPYGSLPKVVRDDVWQGFTAYVTPADPVFELRGPTDRKHDDRTLSPHTAYDYAYDDEVLFDTGG